MPECGGCHNIMIHPQLHNALSNENVEWYGPISVTLRTTLYHPEQLCLSNRREFASPQSAHYSLPIAKLC